MITGRNRKYWTPSYICIITHLLAVVFGMTWMALFQQSANIFSHNDSCKDGSLLGPRNLMQTTTTSSTATNSRISKKKSVYEAPRAAESTNSEKFDILPLIVLDHEWKAQTLKQFVYDVQGRARILSPTIGTSVQELRVGPLYICVPEKAKHVYNYLRKELRSPSDLIANNIVVLQTIEKTESKRECFLSLSMWKQFAALSRKVLVLDEYAALCGNPTHSVLWYSFRYDWIGAAWPWASKPESPHHRGGNGALSIRNPIHLVAILQREAGNMTHGNEDMWFVKKLREWEKDGRFREYNNENGGKIHIEAPVLAAQDAQQSFAVETVVPANRSVTPVGVYHLMRTLPFEKREQILNICPEARRLFRVVMHDGRCSLECSKNFTALNYIKYMRFKKSKDFNSCRDICRVEHPMMEVMANWSAMGME